MLWPAANYLAKPIKLTELDAVLDKVRYLRTLRNDKQHVPKAARKLSWAVRAGERLAALNP